MMNKYKLVFITIVSLFTVAFLAAPASAGCGFFGCGGTLVYVQPQPYVYQGLRGIEWVSLGSEGPRKLCIS
jgi:hypothetical protein